MNKVIRPEQFEATLRKALADYGEDVYEIVVKSAKTAARQTASELKGSAPAGAYARGWSHKAQGNGRTSYTDTAYNRAYPQLTHLLEKPHSTGGGGNYPKNVDYTGTIARAEEKYTEQYMEEVISKL